ncbi:MAG: hypothetical protein ACREJV_02740 [Candidatus Rokuibacteriota bacterium]
MKRRPDGRLARQARGVLLAVPLVVAVGGGAAPSSAEELAPDRTYAAGARVESSRLGVSFVIPTGWVGKFGQEGGNEVLVMGSTTLEGVGLAILQGGQSAAQVAASLNEPQDLGAGVVLRPTAPPAAQGSRISARYQNEIYVGRALALLGSTGTGAVFFFAGPRKNEGAYGQLLEGLASSTSFRASTPATAQREAPAPAGLGQVWSNLLTGHALQYFSSYGSGGAGGGMAERRILHLCPDGRFGYSGDSLITMNVPGAGGSSGGRDGFRGRWSVESPTRSTAVLVLTVEGGRQLRWQLRYDGEKTFLNGQRWFRAPSDTCR